MVTIMSSATGQGRNPSLDFEVFDDVLMDSLSGSTHVVVFDKRKQSLVNAEWLISLHIASLFFCSGHHQEACHIEVLTKWHEVSDGNQL